MPVKQFQYNLLVLGFYEDYNEKHADGMWGKNSVKALNKWQKENNLPTSPMYNAIDVIKIRKDVENLQKSLGLSGKDVDGFGGRKTLKAVVDKNKNSVEEKPTPVPKPEATKELTWNDIKYFNRSEFKCQCKGKYCNGYPVEPSLELAQLLDKIREHFGQPITVTSGVRCPQHNADVGGKQGSKHKEGIAADIQVRGVPAWKVAQYVETLMPNTGGIGRYSNFTHVDIRKQKARW